MTAIYTLNRGQSALIVSMPHCGESLGPYGGHMLSVAARLADTDWHLPRLYDFLPELDATVISATQSRYVIDLNRDPSGKSLYPGQSVTELVPTSTFADEPLYADGDTPDEAAVRARVETCWQPYHLALQAEIARVKALHGYALVWDAHSIRSCVPRFFAGTLPDFNLGTNDGATCDPRLAERIYAIAGAGPDYSAVLNGRFRGGYITRTYGQPEQGVHAIQLELTQCTYMEEAYPFPYRKDRADKVVVPIRRMLEAMTAWKPENATVKAGA